MKRVFLFGLALVLLVVLPACTHHETPPEVEPSELPPLPAERPEVAVPPSFELSIFSQVVTDVDYRVTGDIHGFLFENCEVHISGSDISITACCFRNTQVFVGTGSNITFEKSVFEGLDQYERSALSINESEDISIVDCIFRDNYIGLGIHSSSGNITATRFERNNGHNALVIGEGSSVIVSGNYFYASFPHAILIMNHEGSPLAFVDINNNLIMATGEDAIDFEDYRNASPSVVTGNAIFDTGWSAIIVEYNSWNSVITIRDNRIEYTGIDWKLPVHDLQPEGFRPGWGHGIFIEDSSEIVIEDNYVLSAGENGIEIRNGREIKVIDNSIDCAQVAIAAHRYHESSLDRPFSPLWPDEAGGSEVIAADNYIYRSSREYEADEWSELSID